MKIVVCDWRDAKGEPCSERADLLVSFTDADGKRWELDVCSQLHGKLLQANAREAESAAVSPYTPSVTRLPKAGPKGPTIDTEVKAWAMKKGGDTAAAINQRGRQPKALKEQFLASPEGIVWSQENN